MPHMLERMIMVRDIFQKRKKPDPQLQSQRNIFVKTQQRMNKVSSRLNKRKPPFFSQANEALSGWQPGNRITKIMPVDFGKRRTAKEKTKEMDFSMSVQTT